MYRRRNRRPTSDASLVALSQQTSQIVTAKKRAEMQNQCDSGKTEKKLVSPCVRVRSYCEEVIIGCGLVLDNGDSPNMLCQDQALFVRDLKVKLEGHRAFPRNVDEFMKTFQEYCNNKNNLKKALSMTQITDDSETIHSSQQESLIRLLLSVNCIQSKLITFIFEKLTEFCFSEDRGVENAEFPWIRTLLYQVRFLNCIINPMELTNLLFAVIDAAPDPVKIDVVICLPDIVNDQEHKEIAGRLSELLLDNFSLTAAILETLSKLTMPPELRTKVSEDVLKALQAVPVSFLPSIVTFLVSGTNSGDMAVVIDSLRKHLNFTAGPTKATTSRTQADIPGKSIEVLTMSALRTAVIMSRPLAEAWLAAIKAVRVSSEHCPLDVVMLLVLHEAVPTAKKAVQAIFRNKAKCGHFKETLLERTFSTMLVVLKEYHVTLLEVASALLRSPEPSIMHHASCLFRLLLVHFEGYLGQAAVSQLLIHIGMGDIAQVQSALQVLAQLTADHIDCMIPHELLLLNMLDKVQDMALPEVEQVLDVLCSLAFTSSERQSAIRNDIYMFICKQLASSKPLVKKKGVLGSVMAVKYIAAARPVIEGESLASSLMDLESSRQAIELMELVVMSTQSYPEAMGLFLDKLSSMICKVDDLDQMLIEWISNYVGMDFEENYVCSKKKLKLLPGLQLQYEINGMDSASVEEEEEEEDVCIVLAQLLEQEMQQSRSTPKLLKMNPSIRLVRCIKHLSEGNLSDVAALLGCGVVMPGMLDVDGILRDPDEEKFVLDCMFYCVNWFRELLSAFAYQSDTELRIRMKPMVMQRLSDLLSLQLMLSKYLKDAIDYIPPVCQFYATARPPQPPKSKKVAGKKKSKKPKARSNKHKKKVNDDSAEKLATQEDPATDAEGEEEDMEFPPPVPHDVICTGGMPEYRGFLRELDVDVLILLQEKLVLNADKPGPCLTAPLLLFLLEDFQSKLEHLLTATIKRNTHLKDVSATPIGFSNLDTFTAANFAKNTVKILPELCNKLEMLAEYCQKLLDLNDGVRDSPGMFPEGSPIMKLCYSQLMQIIAHLFTWNGFQSSANTALLKDALRVLASRLDVQGAKLESTKELVREAVQYLQGYTERTIHLPAACSLVKLLEALLSIINMDTTLKKQIVDICNSFLSQCWSTVTGMPEQGAAYNRQLDTLLKTKDTCLDNKLQHTNATAGKVLEELQLLYRNTASRDWSLTVYPTFTRTNFPLLYRSLTTTLVVGMQEQLEVAASDHECFHVWEMAVATLKMLMEMAKLHTNHNNIVTFFKNSLQLLKLFLAQGLHILSRLIRSHTVEVTALLQALQKSTRFLNSICFHSKLTKDRGLTQHVPAMRVLLEQIPMAVRAMMVQNGCGDAFWLGVLKNRNLKGEEVLPQADESNAEDDDLPSEDEASVEDMSIDDPEDNRNSEVI